MVLTLVWLDFAEIISLMLQSTELVLPARAVVFLTWNLEASLFFQRFTLRPLTYAFLTVPGRSVDVVLFLSLTAIDVFFLLCVTFLESFSNLLSWSHIITSSGLVKLIFFKAALGAQVSSLLWLSSVWRLSLIWSLLNESNTSGFLLPCLLCNPFSCDKLNLFILTMILLVKQSSFNLIASGRPFSVSGPITVFEVDVISLLSPQCVRSSRPTTLFECSFLESLECWWFIWASECFVILTEQFIIKHLLFICEVWASPTAVCWWRLAGNCPAIRNPFLPSTLWEVLTYCTDGDWLEVSTDHTEALVLFPVTDNCKLNDPKGWQLSLMIECPKQEE